MRLKEMKVSSPLKGGIYEVSFGYNSKMEGYATLMSDIPKLYAIGSGGKVIKSKNTSKFMMTEVEK
jgi:hypothetical protein